MSGVPKFGWNERQTSNRQAIRCFDDLLEKVQSDGRLAGLEIGIDELVGAISFMWAVAFRKGVLLTNRDLLSGKIIRPMAGELSTSWELIDRAVTCVTDLIRHHKREYLDSIHALVTLWTLHFSALKRSSDLRLTATEIEDLERQLAAALETHLRCERFCSVCVAQWVGNSERALEGYATSLMANITKYSCANDVDAIAQIYQQQLGSTLLK